MYKHAFIEVMGYLRLRVSGLYLAFQKEYLIAFNCL